MRKRSPGISLMSTLLLTTIVMLIAATMAGVFTMNMNITQRVSNGNIALNEAEAGLAEVLYQITRDENIGEENSNSNPQITWGVSGETVRDTITPGMSDEEAFHVVTFDSSSEFPYSTNNTSLSRDQGDLGRTVPDGKLHIVSTGYCKGQYRTIECVVERPPFPFGLAASGKIHSRDPLRVKGVSSLAQLQAGEDDRPGHVLCNSTAGIEIEQYSPQPSPPVPTEISGFVKSAGPVQIEQPATVRGGVRNDADVSTLADIDIESFRNAGAPGVVTILEDYNGESQDMDIMYYFSGDTLTYGSQVNMDQSLLYCDGNLVVNGPLTGEGLIIVNGDATFNSGTALNGSNRLAVLCSGDLTIRGNNNYFAGLIYCEGNLNASNITIVGNTIINSSDDNKGRADLTNVTVVSNQETADMTITVTSSTNAQAATPAGRFPFPMMPGANGQIGVPPGTVDGGDLPGWPEGLSAAEITGMLTGANPLNPNASTAGNEGNLWNVAMSGTPLQIVGYIPPDGGPILAGMQNLVTLANKAQQDLASLTSKQASLAQKQNELDGLDDDDPDDQNRKSDLEDEIRDLESDISDLEDAISGGQAAFDEAAEALGQQVYDYGQAHPDSNGNYDNGDVDLDINQEHRFNLNEYLPESEKIKVSFWRVYPRRL